MAYTPTNWQNGDVITAVKLNKIEQGIADIFCLLYPVNVDYNGATYTPDKTYAEVRAAVDDGMIPFYIFHDGSVVTYILAAYTSSTQIMITNTENSNIGHNSSGIHDFPN